MLAISTPLAWSRPTDQRRPAAAPSPASSGLADDSTVLHPAKDLALRPEGERKAHALVSYIEALDLEEAGEPERALQAFEQVLNIDPGEIDLATRVAALLTREGDYPRAIDILKDAVKAQPKAPDPYLQLAYIYATYLKKLDPALRYATEAVRLAPDQIESYERLCDVQLRMGRRQAAIKTLDRAATVATNSPAYWTQLGKLYVAALARPDKSLKPEDLEKVNAIFRKALSLAQGDASIIKDAADYFAATQQMKEAIPLYLRVLELQPNDFNAREKLATGFLLTNQRSKAITMLQEIVQQHPEKYETYELLGRVLEEDGKALAQETKPDQAKAQFARAAAAYEQSLLINPSQPDSYAHLADLLLVRLHESGRAVRLLQDANRRFPGLPQLTYLLAIALREDKQAQQSVATFEEALQESKSQDSDIADGHFYFEYGAAAEQAGLYDKAADLFKQSIDLSPETASEACNYLGFMWADLGVHLDEAENYIKQALAADPDNGAYLDSLGWVHYREGKYEQALAELLNAAHALTEDDPTVFDHIADTYAKLNQMGPALDYWQKALALDPTNKKLAEKIAGAKRMLNQAAPTAAAPKQ